jgi:hypothetical protein
MIHIFNSPEDFAAEIGLHYDLEPSPDWGGVSETRWELDQNTITVDMSDTVEEKNAIESFMILICEREGRFGMDAVEVHAKLTGWVMLDGKFLATYELTIV